MKALEQSIKYLEPLDIDPLDAIEIDISTSGF